jgi:hypothetical protein
VTNGGEGGLNAIKFSAKAADRDGGGILEGWHSGRTADLG